MRTRAFALAATVAAVGCSPVAAQAPLFLVDSDTRIAALAYDFPEGQTLDLATIQAETALRDPGALAGARAALAWLPLVDRPDPIPFDPLELQRDMVRVERLYQSAGFPRADASYEVQLDTVRNAVDIRVRVSEGPQRTLDEVELVVEPGPQSPRGTGNGLAPELQGDWVALSSRIGSRVGQRLGDSERQAMRAEVSQWVRDRGYPFSRVIDSVTTDTTGLRARLTIEVDPGPRARIDSIEFAGNQALSRRVLLRELPFTVGDWYASHEVAEGQRQIFGLELVRLALGEEPEQPIDSTVTVRYRVNEGRPRLVAGDLGYSTASGLRSAGSWTHRDFSGGARTLTASVDARTSWLALESTSEQRIGTSLTLRQPYLGDRRISGSVEPFVEYRDGTADRSWAVGVGFGALWEKGPQEIVSASYRISRRTVLDVRSASLPGAGDGILEALANVDSLAVGSAHSELVLATTQGRLDDPLKPRRGWLVQSDLRLAGPAAVSTTEYFRAQADLTYHLPVGRRSGLIVKVGGARLFPFGASAPRPQSDTLALLVRLREAMVTAGGTQSVRGWETGLLGLKVPDVRFGEGSDTLGITADRYLPFGGLARLTTSLEVGTPLPWGDGVHRAFAFIDGGKVWNPDPTFGGGRPDPLGQSDFFWGSGVGVEVATVVGPVRVALGYKLNPGVLDVRDPQAVALAALAGQSVETVPADAGRRLRLHLSLGRGF